MWSVAPCKRVSGAVLFWIDTLKPVLTLGANYLGATSVENSLQFRVIQQLSQLLGRDVVVAEVAWREHLHRLFVDLFGTFGIDAKNAKSEGQAIPLWAESKEGIEEQAKRAVDTYNVTVGPTLQITDGYSREELNNAIEREIWRIAPASGGRGARDTLVWFDVCKLLDEGRDVVLVSKDGNAFGHGQQQELLKELPAEHKSRIHFVSDLEDLLRFASIKEATWMDDSKASEIIEEVINKRLVSQYLLWELTNYVPRAQFAGSVFSPGSVGEVTHEIVGKPYGFELDDAKYFAFKGSFSGIFSVIFEDSVNDTTKIWNFVLKGFVSLIAKIDGLDEFSYDIASLTFDRTNSLIRPPDGGEITFEEARKVKKSEGDGLEYRLTDA